MNFTKVFSQNSNSEFEFQLVIENNLMHSDSIELGYDKNADAIIDLKFGDSRNSKTPIRNTLYIRYSFDITSDFHLKRSINIYNCAEITHFASTWLILQDHCLLAFIQIHIQHFHKVG
ncbi:MAG: hypothetical protein IPJ53_17915 [Saprospiraceae bacterium]|nr:hypothetical protein [Candidatus Vicinibacter affinis]